MAHHWRLTKASSTTDRRRVTCSCGRWRALTETEGDAHRLAEEHGREKGAQIVKIESRGRANAAFALNLAQSPPARVDQLGDQR